MHNKLFIADGAIAVIGGRNVADEYYLRRETDNFIDVDAVTVGRVLSALQALFDRYWNSDPVYPLESVARSPMSKASGSRTSRMSRAGQDAAPRRCRSRMCSATARSTRTSTPASST